MRKLYTVIPVAINIEYDDSKITMEKAFEHILDAASAAGWSIQDDTVDFIAQSSANVSNIRTSIVMDKIVAEDYPVLDTPVDYTNPELTPDLIISID